MARSETTKKTSRIQRQKTEIILEAALDVFDGTVLTVTHDRWFVQNFDRFFLLDKEGNVKEVQEPVWT